MNDTNIGSRGILLIKLIIKKIISSSVICFLMLYFYSERTKTVVFTSGYEIWSTAAPIIPADWFGANGGTTQYTPSHSLTLAIK